MYCIAFYNTSELVAGQKKNKVASNLSASMLQNYVNYRIIRSQKILFSIK